MLGLRAMQADLEKQKRKSRNVKIFFFVCAVGIGVFMLFAKDPELKDKLIDKTVGSQIAAKDTGFVTKDANSTYARAEKVTDIGTLESLAAAEAQKMLSSGDTRTFEKEMKNNQLFKDITSGEVTEENLK